jgi:2'-5' RNA ligase
MRYAIHCLLYGPVVEYHRGLVQAVADRFGLGFTRDQGLPSHFTLKYEFETEDVAPVERLVERFCEAYAKTPVTVGGFGEFPPDVAFLEVHLPPEAREVFGEFVRELRGLPWMPWSPYDGENLRFHATVAERCGPRLREVREFLREREATFPGWFDNITLLVQTGLIDGISRWAIHQGFAMR